LTISFKLFRKIIFRYNFVLSTIKIFHVCFKSLSIKLVLHKPEILSKNCEAKNSKCQIISSLNLKRRFRNYLMSQRCQIGFALIERCPIDRVRQISFCVHSSLMILEWAFIVEKYYDVISDTTKNIGQNYFHNIRHPKFRQVGNVTRKSLGTICSDSKS